MLSGNGVRARRCRAHASIACGRTQGGEGGGKRRMWKWRKDKLREEPRGGESESESEIVALLRPDDLGRPAG